MNWFFECILPTSLLILNNKSKNVVRVGVTEDKAVADFAGPISHQFYHLMNWNYLGYMRTGSASSVPVATNRTLYIVIWKCSDDRNTGSPIKHVITSGYGYTEHEFVINDDML